MTILDVMPAVLVGNPVRCDDWLDGLLLRWNVSFLRWEWASAYTIEPNHINAFWQPLPPNQQLLSPITMLSPKWKVITP